MKIIFGLGNPGSKYENNYHNLGFMAIDAIAQKTGIVLNKKGRNGVYGEGNIKGEKVFLVKPETYMNNSGECVSAFMAFYKCPIEDIMVMYDDIDIDKGLLRFRPNGSSGTHNGMRSICAHVGQNFKRLRIGAKNTNPNIPLIDYVLMNITAEDKELIRPAIEKAGECGVAFLNGATSDELMAKFNRKG